jgi:hypothetical protein
VLAVFVDDLRHAAGLPGCVPLAAKVESALSPDLPNVVSCGKMLAHQSV